MRTAIITFSILIGLVLGAAAAPPAPKVLRATDGIFEAFKTRPLVALGEMHGLAQEFDFYLTLVRDPRFAAEVGNIVLEVGGASHQAVVDRYMNGEQVPYAELRKVWSDTVGWFPTVTYRGSITLYAAIREVNAKLPPDKRIKVWLGEPPIDWSTIRTKADWELLANQRDSYPAELISREIVAKDKKALLIWGVGHFGIYPLPNLRTILDAHHPGAMFVVSPYLGYPQKDCAARFERHIKGWPVPSLAGPIRGTALEADIWRKGCSPFTRGKNIPDAAWDAAERNNSGLTADAILYLGPRKSLQNGPRDLDMLMDLEYRAEMDRRYQLRTGEPLGPVNVGPNVAQPFLTD